MRRSVFFLAAVAFLSSLASISPAGTWYASTGGTGYSIRASINPASDGGSVAPVAGTQVDEGYFISLIRSRARVAGLQFDDGPVSQYIYAVPILRSHGFIGSFGIVTCNTNVNPGAMTDAMVWEMYSVYGYHFQDHTWNHDAVLWGNPDSATVWVQHIALSQQVFQRIGFPEPMSSWNEPGGLGRGFSPQLRDTLKAHGYKRAAGRVSLNIYQFRNMHYGSIDDPFSYGRWVYSWKYNAPAAALESMGIDFFSDRGQRLLNVVDAFSDADTTRMDQAFQSLSIEDSNLMQEILAAWTWQAEAAVIITRCAEAFAQGGIPIPVFHGMDADATAGLDAICAWFAAKNVIVLGFDDLDALAQVDRSYQHGLNIAASLHVDLNNDGRPDGYDPYEFIDMNGNANNGAGTTVFGTPPGKLVVKATVSAPLQAGATDDFSMVYEFYTIDPATWNYTTSQVLRSHSIALGQTLTFSDTLVIDERVDRVKFWFQAINTQPFVIDSLTAVPLANPTGVMGRTPTLSPTLRVYPNPTCDGVFTVRTSEPLDISIYDVRGGLVRKARTTKSGEASTVAITLKIASGVYFVKALSGDQRVIASQKITLLK